MSPSAHSGTPRTAALLLLWLVASAFLARPFLIGGDEPHLAAMTSSVAFDRDFALANQYAQVELEGSSAAGKRFAGKPIERHLVEKANGAQFSHGLGLPLLAAPFVWVAQSLFGLPWPDPILGILAVLASFCGLLCGADLLGRFLGDRRQGRFFAVTLFCSSPLWFYSRTFFTEPFVWSGVVVAVWLAARRSFFASGALLGAAILIREPALVVAAPLLVGMALLCGFKASAKAAIGPTVALVAVACRNLFLNGGGLFDFPQPFQYGDVLAGTLGLLLDRGHGLVPFMPLAVLAPFGTSLGSDRAERVVLLCGAAAFILYFLLAASWVDWRGGSCFGPRLIVPALPLLAPAIALAWQRLGRGRTAASFLLVAAALGAALEISAIASPFHAFWSTDLLRLISRSGSATAVFVAAAMLSFVLFRKFNLRPESIVNDEVSAGRSAGELPGRIR